MNFKTWWESEERDADWYLPILAESAWNAALASGYTADARLVELLEAAHSELQWWAAQDIEEPACVTATLDRLNDALMLVRSNAKSQATDAALSRQVACTDGLGVAVPPAPTFEKGENDGRNHN